MGFSAILRGWFNRSRAAVRCVRNYSSTRGAFVSVDKCSGGVSSNASPSPPSPLLIQPPFLRGGSMIYKPNPYIHVKPDEFPDEKAEVVGSSHGWVVLFNRDNNDLFLSHLLSHRLIKLPPIHSLPDPKFNTDVDGQWIVSKVILSSSPDEEECRAMMSYGPAKRLAFCSPGRSSDWTPVCNPFTDYWYKYFLWVKFAQVHDDMVYRSRRKIFTSVTPCNLSLLESSFYIDENKMAGESFFSESYNWDIQDPAASPKMGAYLHVNDLDRRGRTCKWWEENREILVNQCIQIPHLVYAEESDQLFLVSRFVMLMDPEDTALPLGYIPRCVLKGLVDVFPCKTFGFIVIQVDDDDDDTPAPTHSCRVVDDLNGMSMFVGINHSFAIRSSEANPNSIYFTDAKRYPMLSGHDDTGVFDYENKTLCTPPTSASGFQTSPFLVHSKLLRGTLLLLLLLLGLRISGTLNP